MKKFSKLNDIAFHLVNKVNKKKLKINTLILKNWEYIFGNNNKFVKLKDLKGKQFNSFVDFLYDYALIAEGGSPKDPAKYLRQLDKYLS